MKRGILLALALPPLLAAGGCINTLIESGRPGAVAEAGAAPAPNASASTWQMPWQISPVAAASQAAGEKVILSYVPQTGLVRGTSSTLAGLGRPLAAAAGPNRTVNTCRETVQSEAVKVGAKEVEAVSAGPEQRDRKGNYFAPVHVRVTYARPTGLEVRESTLTCIVDAKLRIVDAYT